VGRQPREWGEGIREKRLELDGKVTEKQKWEDDEDGGGFMEGGGEVRYQGLRNPLARDTGSGKEKIAPVLS